MRIPKGEGKKEKDALISVIIPVFNIENFLGRCVDSVRLQTYSNLEIILVDDGSTDRCPELCDHYSETDGRIKVLHKCNGGLSSARNAALREAAGEFLFCLDGDDFIDLNCIEILYRNLIEHRADLSVGNYCYYFESGETRPHGKRDLRTLLTQKEAIELIGRGRDFTGSAWGKLYRRELFDGIEYPEGKLCEDQFVIYKILMRCSRIYFDSRPLYFYFVRRDSIMNSQGAENVLDVVEAARENEKMIRSRYPSLAYVGIYRIVEAYLEVLNRIRILEIKQKKMRYVMEDARDFFRKNRAAILSDTEHICSGKQKTDGLLIALSPKLFIVLHCFFRKMRGMGAKLWKK